MLLVRSVAGIVAVTLGLVVEFAMAVAAPTCECKDVGKSFIVTRLWNVISDQWTDQLVIDEFSSGFAPVVTHLEGFQEYASALTGDPKTVFFMNIFETQELAKTAQEGAKEFVQKGKLNGAITPNQFTENSIDFHIASEECEKTSFKDKYLGTQLWTLKVDESGARIGNLTLTDVAGQFETGFGPTVKNSSGFLEYGGALVTATDYVFFYSFFDTIEGVQQTNDDSEAFVENDAILSANIEKVVFTDGMVGFDYTCAAGNAPDKPADEGGSGSAKTSAAPGSMVGIMAPWVAIMPAVVAWILY